MWGGPGPKRTKVSLGFTGSLDATSDRTGLDCFLMTYALWMMVWGGPIVFSGNCLVFISAEDLSIWLGTGNYRDRSVQAAGSVGTRILLLYLLSTKGPYALTVIGRTSRNKRRKKADKCTYLVFMRPLPQSRKRALIYPYGSNSHQKNLIKLNSRVSVSRSSFYF